MNQGDKAHWFELEQAGQPSLTAAAASQAELDRWVRSLRQGIALAHRENDGGSGARGRAGSGGANWASRSARALRKSFNLAPAEEASVTTHRVLARAPLGSAIDFTALKESVVGEAKFVAFECTRIARSKLGRLSRVPAAIIFTRQRLVIVRFHSGDASAQSHAIITGASPLARASLSAKAVAPKGAEEEGGKSIILGGMYTRRLMETKSDEFEFPHPAEVYRFLVAFNDACHRLPPRRDARPAAGGATPAATAAAAAAGVALGTPADAPVAEGSAADYFAAPGAVAPASASAAAAAPAAGESAAGAAPSAAAPGAAEAERPPQAVEEDADHILTVRVPADAGPGDTVRVRTPDGRVAQVNVPVTHGAGDVFRVRIPKSSAPAPAPAPAASSAGGP